MLTVYRGFLLRLLKFGNVPLYHELCDEGISAETFRREDDKEAFEFVSEFVRTYGELPPLDVFHAKNPSIVLDADSSLAPMSYYVGELRKKAKYYYLSDGVRAADKLLAEDPYKAEEFLEELLMKSRMLGQQAQMVRPIKDIIGKVKDFYLRMKANERGIEFPWKTVNDETLGMWGGDLVLLAARLATGKTFCLLVMVEAALRQGKRVLIVTTEMSDLRMVLRWMAIRLGISYRDLRRGKLRDDDELLFFDEVERQSHVDQLWVTDSGFNLSIPTVRMATKRVKPHIVFVDSAYLLEGEGRNERERVNYVFRGLKEIGRTEDIPIVGNTQINRDSVKTGETRADHLSFSDAVGQLADIVGALIQTDEDRDDKKMKIKFLKAREGYIPDLTLNWDLENGNFTEVLKVEPIDTSASDPTPPMGALRLIPGGKTDHTPEIPPEDEPEMPF